MTEITGEVARFTVIKISGNILNSTGHIYFLSCLIVANLYVRPKIYDFVNSQVRLPEGFAMWDAFQRVKNVDRCTTTQKKYTLWQGLDVLYCRH